MIIFESTKRKLRNWIEDSNVRTNILRLCSRRPYTLPELAQVRLREAPRLQVSPFGKLSEINVTVGIGESLNRELLVKVGKKPQPTGDEAFTDKLRTTLFAFLMSPKLALLEPEAYTTYIDNWFSQPPCKEHFLLPLGQIPPPEATLLFRLQRELSLVFPEYLHRSFATFRQRPGLEEANLGQTNPEDRKRIFGKYYVDGLLTDKQVGRSPSLGLLKLFRLTRTRIEGNLPRLKEFLEENGPQINQFLATCSIRKKSRLNYLFFTAKRFACSSDQSLHVDSPSEKTLQANRLGPFWNI